MDEKTKSLWKKSWSGPRALLFWLLIVTIAAFLAAVAIAAITFVSTPVPFFAWGGGFRNFIGCVPIVMFWFIVAVAMAFIFYGIVRWLFCWRNLKRTLFVIACLVTLVALFYAEEDWRGKHAWERFKREWEAKGEHFDYASVVPPSVPDDKNFAMAPIWVESIKATLGPERARQWKYPDSGRTNYTDRLALNLWHYDKGTVSPTNGIWAKGTITELKTWQTYYRAPAPTDRRSTIITNEFPVAPRMQTPAEDVLLALSKYDSAIEDLRAASKLPYSRFPLNYDSENPAVILLPQLSLLQRCASVLQLRAIAELQNDQSDKALDDVKLMLQLTDSIRTEPILISHLVRIAILQLALQPVWEGLARHQWSEAQLIELDRELAGLDFLADYKLPMRGELVLCQVRIIDYLRRHPEQISNMSGDSDSPWSSLTARISYLIPSGWFYQNQLRCARLMVQQYLPLADLDRRIVSPASARHASAAISLEFRRVGPYNRLEAMFIPALGAAVRKFANAQESVDLARVAISLERYRLAHGEYPELLDALVPQFIARLPHDVINGQPLHYRRASDGQFVLYSVGWNETDDGGEVGLRKDGSVNIEKGDWVWRYPQK